MTKDSLFKLLVPRRFRKMTTEYRKHPMLPQSGRPVTCQGAKRAARRRALRSDAWWHHANEVALPYRIVKWEWNKAAMALAAALEQGRLAVIRRLFGKRAA
jgi:hypothetical protein